MRLFILALLVICARASPQYVKTAGVKGGYSGQGYQYHGGQNLASYYNNSTQQQGYGGYAARNLTEATNYEKGVCYVEVPTASLVSDPAHAPTGNGSRPDLSRIRSCCRGYIKNIYNYRLCDPVCTKGCVNGLCSAPETCSCYPDHIMNLAGFCVPTCPIGCQNGQCSGGECICKDGYRLDSDSKFCVPYCREQCGGMGQGNCTAPNTCECKNGYISTPEGSCKSSCDRCRDGECVAPNDCRCSAGYSKNEYGDCIAHCSSPCTPPNRCIAPNVCGNPSNPSSTITLSPYDLHQAHHPNIQIPTRPPYGQQPQYPNYPGNQQSNYPGNPQHNLPGYQQVNYTSILHPGFLQNNYTGYQPSKIPGNPQFNYPGNQQSVNPQYPGNLPPYPGGQNNNPDYRPYNGNPENRPQPLPQYPGNQYNNSSNQQPSHNPYLRPVNNIDGQPIYTNIPNNQPLYPDSQHVNPDQRPNNLSPNSSQTLPNSGVNYPNSQYYPGSQHYPDQQRPYPNQPNQRPDMEPYYPNSQYHPGGQQNYPYNNNYQIQPNQPHYPSNTPGSEYQHIYPDSQSGDLMCSHPCVNGTCVGRDRCACNTGYVPIAGDTSRCEPHCSGCSNGVCVSPYVCQCNPGYYKDFSVKGKTSCVRRIRRSADASVADLLVFEIPDDYNN